ncbi:MAG: hypothetical protein KatS3mg115_1240 [Candidatus Poribacteria bacterium]|nr:MAG: hypothetical protein KatS3mg115_1240 [Candidatus Poribacteria bacterium]
MTLESLPMERFLFREVIANAQQVVLSCPRLERGRMLVPSPFLEDLRTALRAELPEEPPSADSKAYLSTREVLLEMGRRLNAEGAERLCPFLSAEGGQEALPENVATLIAMERLRSSREQWSRFDGYLDPLPVEVAEYLRRHADRPQAPSQLRLYVLCSIRYLFRELLGLRRMRPSEPEVPPTLRGTLVHTILERYFREGPPADDLERERRRLAQIAEEVLAPYDAVFDSLYWQVEKERLTAGLTGSGAEEKGVLAQFLELEREFEAFFSGSGWQRGARVEVRFEEGSEILPLAVEGPAGTVRIAGRIDRVDLNPEAGQALIVDYKVGSRAPRVQDVLEGIELQLPLYLAMIPRLFESVEPVEPVGGVYYHLHPFGEVQVGSGLLLQEAAGPKLRGRRFLVESQEAFREALSRAQQAVLRIREHLSAGRFPWTQFEPSQAGCPFCDFATICRLDDSRREEMRSFQPVFEPIPLLPTAEVTGPEEAE